MMRDNNKLRKDLQNHPSPVNIDEIWNTIEPQVDLINEKRRKKRRFFFFFCFMGIFLSGAAFYYFLNPSDSLAEKNLVAKQTEISKTKSPQKSEVHQQEELNISSGTPDLSANLPVSNKNETKNKNNNRTLKTKQVAGIDIKPKNSTRKIGNSILFPSKKLSNSIEKTPGQNTNEKISSKLNTNTTKEASQNAIAITQKEAQTLSTFAILPTLAGTISSINPDLVFPEIQLYKKEERNNKQVGFSFSVKAFSGLAYANKTLASKNADVNALLPIRKDSESSLEVFQWGGQIELRHSSGWAFASGLQRTRIAERYEFMESLVEVEMIRGLKSIRVDLYGDSIHTFGELPLTRTTISRQKIYNYYTLLDLPLLLGYYHQSGKWEAGIQAGVLANISLKTKGKIRNQDTWDIDLAEKQNELFKSRIGWSYYLGLSIERSLAKGVVLSFSPHFQYYSSDFAQRTYGISQKYVLWGGKIGVGITIE